MEAIRIDGLGFSYPGMPDVLSDVDMALEEGSCCVIVGNSGSGKTTLLRCLVKAMTPAGDMSGEIQLFGRPIKEMQDEFVCGYVQQDPDSQIVCDKVWRELAFGLESLGTEEGLLRRRVAEVSTFFDLGAIFNRDCETLSGGQKQTVNVASVFAMGPKILLLDEPTAQLDPMASLRLVDMVSRIRRTFGTTVVIATHSPEQFCHIATCAYRLGDGTLEPIDVSDLDLRAEDENPPCYGSDRSSNEGSTYGLAVSVRRATLSYSRQEGDVLDGLDLEVRKGEILSLVGANGCGKSTLLKLVAGTLLPISGRIDNMLSMSQGFVPQNVGLLFSRDTVFEELMDWSSSAGYAESDAASIAERFMLSSLLDANPFDLSYGQQKKLAIAKMLLCSPELLILDEPSCGLDGQSQMEVARILVGLSKEGKTVLIATHDLEFASRISSRMALLFDGVIACIEDSRSFCEQNLFYRPSVTRFSLLWDEAHGGSERFG